MGFIDTMRGEGFAVETICQVLREQGVAVAARTYRAWKAPNRVLAARTFTDAVVVDTMRGLRTDAEGKATPESLYGRRKMTALLRRRGLQVAHCTVDRLMRATARCPHARRTIGSDPTPSQQDQDSRRQRAGTTGTRPAKARPPPPPRPRSSRRQRSTPRT